MKRTKRSKDLFFCAIAIFVALQFSANDLKAQYNLSKESSKMQMAYKNQTYLSFDVKYTYAFDSIPGTILDSALGTFKISGNFYWGNLDSMEFMQNSSYAIVLYKPDKIMNVSNPSPIYPTIANFSLIDSLVGKNNYTTSVSTSGANRAITLTFTPSSFPYKNFIVTYDTISNLVKQISYSIREDFYDFGDNYNRSSTGNSSPYIIIKADYTNYQTTSFSPTIFSTGNYFILSGSVYTAQSPFSDYEVFIASSNLLK